MIAHRLSHTCCPKACTPETLEASPYPILSGMSRQRIAALRFAASLCLFALLRAVVAGDRRSLGTREAAWAFSQVVLREGSR